MSYIFVVKHIVVCPYNPMKWSLYRFMQEIEWVVGENNYNTLSRRRTTSKEHMQDKYEGISTVPSAFHREWTTAQVKMAINIIPATETGLYSSLEHPLLLFHYIKHASRFIVQEAGHSASWRHFVLGNALLVGRNSWGICRHSEGHNPPLGRSRTWWWNHWRSRRSSVVRGGSTSI